MFNTTKMNAQEEFRSLSIMTCIYDFQVFVNDQFLNWDPNNQIKVRIVSARAYHSLFMHNMYVTINFYMLTK